MGRIVPFEAMRVDRLMSKGNGVDDGVWSCEEIPDGDQCITWQAYAIYWSSETVQMSSNATLGTQQFNNVQTSARLSPAVDAPPHLPRFHDRRLLHNSGPRRPAASISAG